MEFKGKNVLVTGGSSGIGEATALAFAKLLAPWGRANAVSPGTVKAGYWLTASKEETEENLAKAPINKFIEPKDIANAIVFLASDKARMITGQNLVVDGGYTLV